MSGKRGIKLEVDNIVMLPQCLETEFEVKCILLVLKHETNPP